MAEQWPTCDESFVRAADAAAAQREWDPDHIVILSGSGGEHLAEELTGLIGLPTSSSVCHDRAAGSAGRESAVRLPANVRGRDVFVVQSTCHPVNDTVIELALIISACQRASARRVTAVTPYLAYSRQAIKSESRVPISSADVANLFEEACLDALVTVDIRDPQIAGFYSPRCAFHNCSYNAAAARFLYSIEPASLELTEQDDGAGNVYTGTLEIAAADAFLVSWEVAGPSKEGSIISMFTRRRPAFARGVEHERVVDRP